MKTLAYTLTFLTPAFLGDAEQSGRWRTPPIKALLRQWWRVVYAADHEFNVKVDEMRCEEGLLFGNAYKENGREISDHRKSLVRLRLDRWEEGQVKKQEWGQQEVDKEKEGVNHPEVGRIGPKLYLGYGPLVVEKVKTKGKKPEYATVLKNNAAIQAGEGATLSLAWPTQHPSGEVQKILDDNNQRRRLERALWLMDRYGTLGGRSRNGWGSFSLHPLPLGEGWGEGMTPPVRPWRDCLDRDWPHAIGKDDKGPLVWQTAKIYDDWKSLMRDLAIVKIGLRTQFVFPNTAPPHPRPLERHWLAYPITRHTTKDFDRNARLPNSLRFKVRRVPNEPKKLVAVIFHLPLFPPSEFRPVRPAIEHTWQTVHGLLDELCKAMGDRSYISIKDEARRLRLKPQLDMVMLTRISE